MGGAETDSQNELGLPFREWPRVERGREGGGGGEGEGKKDAGGQGEGEMHMGLAPATYQQALWVPRGVGLDLGKAPHVVLAPSMRGFHQHGALNRPRYRDHREPR